MDAINNLTTQTTLLSQQLQIIQLQQRVASQPWNSYMHMEQVQYGGSLYLNTYNSRWQPHPHLSWNSNFNVPQPSQEKKAKLEEALEELVKVEAERVASQKRMHLEETLAQFAISHAQVMDETRGIFQSQATILQSQATQIQNQEAQLRNLELQLGQMAKLLLEKQQASLLIPLEVNLEEEELEHYEAFTLRIANEVGEQHREEMDAKKPHVIVEEEKESTSPKPEEKKEEVETILEMTVWEEMHELNNETEPYILEVEGTLNKYGQASKVKKAPKSLRRHADLQNYVLK